MNGNDPAERQTENDADKEKQRLKQWIWNEFVSDAIAKYFETNLNAISWWENEKSHIKYNRFPYEMLNRLIYSNALVAMTFLS